jgi:hypothetical protein
MKMAKARIPFWEKGIMKKRDQARLKNFEAA